ncbi:MAG: tRNA (N(6)-L-threonylcarbamoyladenosine(37)-C(2))-methylthiotransferase [Methanotrichaceae archaeon]
MRFHIETYGCTANLGNSRALEAALSEMGHRTACLEDAEIVIVNTCAVTEKTERKMLRRLHQLQGDRLIIGGCLPAALPFSIEGIKYRLKAGILGPSAIKEIAELFDRPPFGLRDIPAEEEARQDLCGIVNIAEGCCGGCSYCIVRKARGNLVSRNPGDIVEAVRNLTGSGMAEIQLTAQDSAAYGRDSGTDLPELLDAVKEVPGDFMIRIGMMNPDTLLPMLDDLISVLHSPKIYKFIHLPVQSGSDGILESMGRKYTADDFLGIIDRFRGEFEDIFLMTDIITGFPGETDEDFRKTLELIRSAEPDKVNVTRFSLRPGTGAARLYDMPDRIKKDRSREITRLWMEIARIRNQRYEGRVLDATVTERGLGDTAKARSCNYAGIVIAGSPRLGSKLRVIVTGSNPFYLIGSAQTR